MLEYMQLRIQNAKQINVHTSVSVLYDCKVVHPLAEDCGETGLLLSDYICSVDQYICSVAACKTQDVYLFTFKSCWPNLNIACNIVPLCS